MTNKCKEVYDKISNIKQVGKIKALAKELKTDHSLAEELWNISELSPRLLSVLLLDNKQLTQGYIEKLVDDLNRNSVEDRNKILDWLLVNKLMKSRRTTKLIETWKNNEYPPLRRLFWYYQARLRWTGKHPPDNTHNLMVSLEKKLLDEAEEVQWAMNFCCGQIGIHEDDYTKRCIELGEKSGLYKSEKVSKDCPPNYLPDFIRMERSKLGKSTYV